MTSIWDRAQSQDTGDEGGQRVFSAAMGFGLRRQAGGDALDQPQQGGSGLDGPLGLERLDLTVSDVFPEPRAFEVAQLRGNFPVRAFAVFKDERGEGHDRHVPAVDDVDRLLAQESDGLEFVG